MKHIALIIIGMFLMNLNMAQVIENSKKQHLNLLNYTTELNLNELQIEKIKAIQKEYHPQLKALKNQGDKVAIKQLNEERLLKIKQILTVEQIEKWQAIKEKMHLELQNPELKKALRDYKHKNILPVLKEKRVEFEKELTANEKQVIADQRAKINALKAARKNLTKEQIQQRRKELKLEVNEALKPIVENHKTAFEKLKSELAPHNSQWKSDIDSIKLKFISNSHPKKGRKANKNKSIQFLLLKTEE